MLSLSKGLYQERCVWQGTQSAVTSLGTNTGVATSSRSVVLALLTRRSYLGGCTHRFVEHHSVPVLCKKGSHALLQRQQTTPAEA